MKPIRALIFILDVAFEVLTCIMIATLIGVHVTTPIIVAITVIAVSIDIIAFPMMMRLMMDRISELRIVPDANVNDDEF
jgi:hypothetical protein